MITNNNDFKFVFIDDNLSIEEPLVQILGNEYEGSDFEHVFNTPDEGVNYVLGNLNQKMIVFIDWNYGGRNEKGIDVLKKIREKTSLLYLVMMSAYPVTSLPDESIIEMMNEENFFYYDSNNDVDFSKVKNIVDTIKKEWDNKFDCVLEQWLSRHPEDKEKIAYSTYDKQYTWGKLLDEIRRQTKVGRDLLRSMNQLVIYKLKRKNNE